MSIFIPLDRRQARAFKTVIKDIRQAEGALPRGSFNYFYVGRAVEIVSDLEVSFLWTACWRRPADSAPSGSAGSGRTGR